MLLPLAPSLHARTWWSRSAVLEIMYLCCHISRLPGCIPGPLAVVDACLSFSFPFLSSICNVSFHGLVVYLDGYFRCRNTHTHTQKQVQPEWGKHIEKRRGCNHFNGRLGRSSQSPAYLPSLFFPSRTPTHTHVSMYVHMYIHTSQQGTTHPHTCARGNPQGWTGVAAMCLPVCTSRWVHVEGWEHDASHYTHTHTHARTHAHTQKGFLTDYMIIINL